MRALLQDQSQDQGGQGLPVAPSTSTYFFLLLGGVCLTMVFMFALFTAFNPARRARCLNCWRQLRRGPDPLPPLVLITAAAGPCSRAPSAGLLPADPLKQPGKQRVIVIEMPDNSLSCAVELPRPCAGPSLEVAPSKGTGAAAQQASAPSRHSSPSAAAGTASTQRRGEGTGVGSGGLPRGEEERRPQRDGEAASRRDPAGQRPSARPPEDWQ